MGKAMDVLRIASLNARILKDNKKNIAKDEMK